MPSSPSSSIRKPSSNDECRWRRRKAARPEEILDAALRLFTKKGFSATRMIDIANAAGISKGTLYLYFDSKQQVFKQLILTVLSPIVSEAENTLTQHTGSKETLIREFIEDWWRNIWDTDISAIPKLIIAESGNFPELAEFYTESIVRRVRRLFESIIQQGIDNGEFEPCDTKIAARLLIAPIIHICIWKHSLKPYEAEFDVQSYLETHLTIFLSGLKKTMKVPTKESKNAHS